MADAPPLTVSVLTPSLNQGELLGGTLRSVAAQGAVVLEHHVIDGASTDQTLDVLRGAAQPGLRWVSERDRGAAHAINKGIARARGDLIAWIRPGEIYRPGALAAAAALLRAQPQVDVVYGRVDPIDRSAGDDAARAPRSTDAFDLAQLHERCFLRAPAVVFRRDCVERFGLLDERLQYCMDYEYWLRIARSGARFAYLPALHAQAQQHPHGEPAAARVARQREIIEMFRRLQGQVPSVWMLRYAAALAGRFIDRQRQPRLYATAATAGAVLAALRWNHRLPWDLRTAARRAGDGDASPLPRSRAGEG